MAQATDLPIELYDLILSFLPPNHAEQVQWRRAAAAIGRESRPVGWNLSDHRCRRCGRVCLAMWDHEERKEWVIQRWGYWGPRQWALAGFFILCPCDAMLGNYFGTYWFVWVDYLFRSCLCLWTLLWFVWCCWRFYDQFTFVYLLLTPLFLSHVKCIISLLSHTYFFSHVRT